ncbi:MAG: hypothetical protein RL266_183 [Bacteroidota bacterium]|jgi:hypothetical protein
MSRNLLIWCLLLSCWKGVLAQQTYFSLSHSFNSDYGFGCEIIGINDNYYWGTWGKSWTVNDHNDYYGLLKLGESGAVQFEAIVSDTVEGEYVKPTHTISGDSIIVSLTSYYFIQPYVVNHWTTDLVLTKYDTIGNILSQLTLVDSGYTESPRDILSVDDGFLLLYGQTVSFGSGPMNTVLRKIDFEGNTVWSQTLEAGSFLERGDSASFFVSGWPLVKYDSQGIELWSQPNVGGRMTTLSDGGFLFTREETLAKTDSSGNVVWSQQYALGDNRYLRESIELPDGSFLSVGQIFDGDDGNPETGGDSESFGWLIKTNSNGQLIWERRYTDTHQFTNLAPFDGGGFLLSGQNKIPGPGNAWLIHVDSLGYNPNHMVDVRDINHSAIIRTWPNPCVDVLNLDFSASQAPLEMTVVDVIGKEILRFAQNDKQESIDVSGWPSGAYILSGTDEKGRSFSVRILKQ